MVKRLIAFALFTTVLAIGGGLYGRRAVTQDFDLATLAGMAAQAQAQGQTEVVLGKDISWEGVDDLNSALSRYTVVDAVPIAKQSYVLDEFSLGTWYKFRLNSILKQNPLVTCSQCSSNMPDPPAEMLPLNANEILVLHAGGSQLVNGVTVIVTVSEFPDFTLNQRYLLFIDFDAGRSVATVAVGPPGVYLVDANGRLVHIYEADAEDTIGSGLAANYGSNIDTLRNALNPPPPPPPSGCDPVLEQNCYDSGGNWNSSNCSCFNVCFQKPWLCE
jgi:hypothetical protein